MRWLREVDAGLKHLFGPPALRRATIGFVMAVAVIGLTETLVFAYVDQGLHRPPAFVSVLVCVQGVGGLTGGLLAARVVRPPGRGGRDRDRRAAVRGRLRRCSPSPTSGCGFACRDHRGCRHPDRDRRAQHADATDDTTRRCWAGWRRRPRRSSAPRRRCPSSLGAVLVTLVDYRLLFVAMAVVMAVLGGVPVARPAVGGTTSHRRGWAGRRARATRPARRAVP